MIVGRALRPIELMRREVASVAGSPGLHRVVEPETDDEVGRLARTLNSMLDRIESSSERERRFVSDASHELRSPIANVRTELEVALHRPAAADWPVVATGVLGENERMDRLVEVAPAPGTLRRGWAPGRHPGDRPVGGRDMMSSRT